MNKYPFQEDLTKISYISSKLSKYLFQIVEDCSNLADFFNHRVVQAKHKFSCNTDDLIQYIHQEEQKGNLIHYFSKNYPEKLKNIADAPIILYIKGDISLLAKQMIAIIGSRTPSIINQKLAKDLAEYCFSNNVTTISGMASGIDSIIHHNSLKNTVAVLGFGFDWIYPRENKKLLDDLSNNSLVISEYHYSINTTKYNFPKRNRLIAALSNVTIIIEAKENSGSLITAKYALEYSKNIFAVPGHSYDYKSAGCNKLISEGAYLLKDFSEILEMLPYNTANNNEVIDKKIIEKIPNNIDHIKQQILHQLSDSGVIIDELFEKINVPSDILLENLSNLEMDDFIYRDNLGKIYRNLK